MTCHVMKHKTTNSFNKTLEKLEEFIKKQEGDPEYLDHLFHCQYS